MDIDSPKNPHVVDVARLHRRRHRRIEAKTLLEGPNLLSEALDGGIRIEEVFVLAPLDALAKRAADCGAPVHVVSEAVLRRLAGTEHPRGPVAVIGIPESPPISRQDSVALVGVADPGNVGTIARSAAAFGFQFIVSEGCADPWSPKVLRSGAGAHFSRPVVHASVNPLSDLSGAGLVAAALVVEGGDPIESLGPDPVALLVGSEPHGLPAEIVAECHHRVTIPMSGGFESLNAAVAASIAMYERSRHRD